MAVKKKKKNRLGRLNQRQKFVINELLPCVLESALHFVTASFVMVTILLNLNCMSVKLPEGLNLSIPRFLFFIDNI
jgi:hypothetical protein